MNKLSQRLARTLIDYLDRRLGGHAGSGPEYTFYCPACIDRIGSEAHGKKLAINVDRRKGQCFRCEFKFREFEHLFRYINGGFLTPEERMLLREDPPIVVGSVYETTMGLLYPSIDDYTAKLRVQKLPPDYVALSEENLKHPAYRRAHRYLRNRGVSLKRTLQFKLGYCASGEYRGYLIFPVVQEGRTVYWTSRYAGHHRLKSRNPEKRDGYFSRENCLLNYDNVVGKPVVAMVEGGFDSTAPRAAFGLMGRIMSPAQAHLIVKLVDHGLEELVLMLDPGTGEDMDNIRMRLCDDVPKITMLTLDHGDPSSRRDDLPSLMGTRRVPTLTDRIRSRFAVK